MGHIVYEVTLSKYAVTLPVTYFDNLYQFGCRFVSSGLLYPDHSGLGLACPTCNNIVKRRVSRTGFSSLALKMDEKYLESLTLTTYPIYS